MYDQKHIQKKKEIWKLRNTKSGKKTNLKDVFLIKHLARVSQYPLKIYKIIIKILHKIFAATENLSYFFLPLLTEQ